MECRCCSKEMSISPWTEGSLIEWYERLDSEPLLKSVGGLLKEAQQGRCGNCGYEFYLLQNDVDHVYYRELTHAFPKYFADSRAEWQLVSKIVNAESHPDLCTVVDIGCGSGSFLHNLNDEIAKIGVDFESHVDFGSNIRFFQQNLNKIESLPKGDYYVSFQVMEHLVDPDAFLRSIKGNASYPSKLFLTVPNSENYRNKRFLDPLNVAPHHLSRFTLKSLEALLPKHFASFKITPIEPISLPRILVRIYNQSNERITPLSLVRATYDWFLEPHNKYESFLIEADLD